MEKILIYYTIFLLSTQVYLFYKGSQEDISLKDLNKLILVTKIISTLWGINGLLWFWVFLSKI